MPFRKILMSSVLALVSWTGGMVFQKIFGDYPLVLKFCQEDHRLIITSSSGPVRHGSSSENSTLSILLERCNTNDDDTQNIIRILQMMSSTKYQNRTPNELSIVNEGVGFGGVLEIEDPMGGRYHRCLEKYFLNFVSMLTVQREEWPILCTQMLEQKVQLLDVFFEWLDYGPGRSVEVEKCQKETFDVQRYKKLTPTERSAYKISLLNNSDVVIRNSNVGQQQRWNATYQFVYGTDHNLYLFNDKEHPRHTHFGHASIFAGRPILMAGEMGFVADPAISTTANVASNEYFRLVLVSDASGHYRPRKRHVQLFYMALRDRHLIHVESIQWMVRDKPVDMTFQ